MTYEENRQYCKGRDDAIEQMLMAFVDQEEFYFGCYRNDEHSCKEVHCFSCMENFFKKACGVE